MKDVSFLWQIALKFNEPFLPGSDWFGIGVYSRCLASDPQAIQEKLTAAGISPIRNPRGVSMYRLADVQKAFGIQLVTENAAV